MEGKELLIVKNKSRGMQFKIVPQRNNMWAEARYKKIIPAKDPRHLASLMADLHSFGYPIEKAYKEYKRMFRTKDDIFF